MLSSKQVRSISDNVVAFMEWMQGVESGLLGTGLKFVIDPTTTTRATTSATWTRRVTIKLTDENGNVCTWFNDAIASGVTIGETSEVGTATIPSTTLTFVNGEASVVITGDAVLWSDGTKQAETATVLVGVNQVETITITNQCTCNGSLKITVTAVALGTSSPHSLYVPLTSAVHTTPTLVASAIRTALNADATITGAFTIDATVDANVVLTTVNKLAPDNALEIAIATSTGITVGSSTDALGGAVGTAQVETMSVTNHVSGTAGTMVFTLTSDSVVGSPLAVNIPILTAANSATKVAVVIMNALKTVSAITDWYTITTSTADVILTANAKIADDVTLSLDLTNADDTGVTVGASTSTTPGVLAINQKESIAVTAVATNSGTVKVVVTSANMSGSPNTTYVDLVAGDTITGVIDKLVIALNSDVIIAAFAITERVGTSLVFTTLTPAGTDATLALAITIASGVTAGVSTNTLAGIIGSVTTSGNCTATVTSALGSATGAVTVAVLEGDTASDVATKIRAAFNLDSDITDYYTVGGTGVLVSLTTIEALAADDTLNIALIDGTSAGVITAETSADTTDGVVAETNTLTVAQATIQESTVAGVTSVETIV